MRKIHRGDTTYAATFSKSSVSLEITPILDQSPLYLNFIIPTSKTCKFHIHSLIFMYSWKICWNNYVIDDEQHIIWGGLTKWNKSHYVVHASNTGNAQKTRKRKVPSIYKSQSENSNRGSSKEGIWDSEREDGFFFRWIFTEISSFSRCWPWFSPIVLAKRLMKEIGMNTIFSCNKHFFQFNSPGVLFLILFCLSSIHSLCGPDNCHIWAHIFVVCVSLWLEPLVSTHEVGVPMDLPWASYPMDPTKKGLRHGTLW